MEGQVGEYRTFELSEYRTLRGGGSEPDINIREIHLWGWQFVAVIAQQTDEQFAELMFKRVRICTPEEQP